MKISTRSRYGLRFMIYLGSRYKKDIVDLNEVAREENISKKYLEQIVPYLKAANLVISHRGAEGGYELARGPETINLKEIISPLEGNYDLVDCSEKGRCDCELREVCAARDVWNELGEMISNYFEQTKLKNLVDSFEEKRNKKSQVADMYYI